MLINIRVNRLWQHKKIIWPLLLFYPIFCLASLLGVWGIKYPIIPIIKVLYFISTIYLFFSRRLQTNIRIYSLIALLFIIALSSLNYAFQSYPTDLLFDGFQKYFFPASFMIFGLVCTRVEKDDFYLYTYYGLMFTYVVGFYLFFVQPTWYLSWRVETLTEWLGSGAESYVETKMNMSSFFLHPYFVGYTSIFALSYSLCKLSSREHTSIWYLGYCISLLSMLLAQQRVSVVCGFFSILFTILLEKSRRKRMIFLLFTPIVMFVVYFILNYVDLFQVVFDRFSTIWSGEVLSDGRSNQWIKAFKHWNNILIGDGFNLYGHKALSHGMHSIADGEFFKFLIEIGIIGTVVFYYFFLRVLMFAFLYKKIYTMEISTIVCFLVGQIGANTFEMENIIILCWFCIGVILNKNLFTDESKNNCILSSSISSDTRE